MIAEADVSLEMLIAEVTARNIALNAGDWETFADVPPGVYETLAAQPKTLATILKKHGKKTA